MIRRDLKVLPAITSGLSSRGTSTGALPPPMKCTISQPVAVAHLHMVVGRARHDHQIALHRDLGRVQSQRFQQGAQGRRLLQRAGLAIQCDVQCHDLIDLKHFRIPAGEIIRLESFPPTETLWQKKPKQSKTLPIHILNGPNLNLLGHREPEVYGKTTLAEIEKMCAAQAASYGLSIVFRQSNHEGEIVDQLQEARTGASAVIINPAGYGHTSIAILDSIQALTISGDRVSPVQHPQARAPIATCPMSPKAPPASSWAWARKAICAPVDAIANILKVKK